MRPSPMVASRSRPCPSSTSYTSPSTSSTKPVPAYLVRRAGELSTLPRRQPRPNASSWCSLCALADASDPGAARRRGEGGHGSGGAAERGRRGGALHLRLRHWPCVTARRRRRQHEPQDCRGTAARAWKKQATGGSTGDSRAPPAGARGEVAAGARVRAGEHFWEAVAEQVWATAAEQFWAAVQVWAARGDRGGAVLGDSAGLGGGRGSRRCSSGRQEGIAAEQFWATGGDRGRAVLGGGGDAPSE